MAVKTLSKKPTAPGARAGGVPSRALSKGLQIIELLSAAESPLSLGAIAREIRLGKPSTFRLLQTLVSAGFAGTSGKGDYYPIRRFAAIHESTWIDDLIAASREEMERMNVVLAETVTLAALHDDHIRVIHTLESSREIRMSNYLSRILSPYASSLGKAIAAYQSPARLNQLLQVYGVYQFTSNTVTEPTLIREELARIRERGYSSEFEETVPGGCCIGVPICGDNQHVRAALSVSLPVARLTEGQESKISEMLKEAAARIGTNLTAGHAHARKSAKTNSIPIAG
jgi:IclR family acetate operon transcriptional repressor